MKDWLYQLGYPPKIKSLLTYLLGVGVGRMTLNWVPTLAQRTDERILKSVF